MKRYQVVLFQPYIRSFVTNFAPYFKDCSFQTLRKPEETKSLYTRLTTFENEINRTKTNLKHKLRRLIGVPAVRIKFTKHSDLLFTYGALVIGNKPYCAYLETGLAPYSYDRGIADNPVARFIVSTLIRQKNCRKLIFLSQASLKSFLVSAKYSSKTQEVFHKKATVCYPLMESQVALPKKLSETLRLLFIGTFYIKGGLEVLKAFQRLRATYGSRVTLTIITSVSVLRDEDIHNMKSMEGLTFHNAAFSKEEMHKFYQNHDLFLMPTYRDGFGLVWIEALSFGLPIIGTDQYATGEMCNDGKTGFLYKNHPLQDYDSTTFEIFGKYYNPKVFYTELFTKEKNGEFKLVEDFLVHSVEKFLTDASLLERFSENSLTLYQEKFAAELVAQKMEQILVAAIENKE